MKRAGARWWRWWGRRLAPLVLAAAGATSLGAREVWRKVATPDFTVVTSLAEREALAAAREFAQYVAAQQAFFGGPRPALPALTIVIFAHERDFEAYRPLDRPGGKPLNLGGFFSRHESWAVVGMPARVSEDTRRTIFHEGVHWFLSASRTRNPVWIEEGLAEVFSTFHAGNGVAEWGRVIESHVRLLRQVAPMPLAQLLEVPQAGLGGDDRHRTGIVYAGSWAFVHYLMFGKHEIPRTAITAYLEAVTGGATASEAARRVFGRPPAELDRALRRYLDDGDYFMARLPLAQAETPVVSPASPAEVEHALGRLALAGRRGELAMRHAGAMIALASEDPRGHELLGLALKAKGDSAGAVAAFETAIAHRSTGFQPYYEVAQAAHRTAGERTLDGAAARRIADLYGNALQRYPRHQLSYENLAGLMSLVEPLRDEDRRWLELGRRLYPGSGMIQLGVAQAMRRAGDPAGASDLVDQLLAARSALSPEVAGFASRLLAGWEQDEIGRRIDELGRAGRFRAALEFLDAKLEGRLRPEVRERFKPVREQLAGAVFAEDVKHALDAQDWVAARRHLGALLESAAPPPLKEQARRTLAELDQKRLGIPSQPP